MIRRATAAPGVPGRRSFVVMGLLWTLWIALPTPVTGQLSVQPVIVEMRAGNGAANASLLVRNEGSEPLALQAYATDFDQPEEGGHTFLPAGEHPRSCKARLQFFPESFEVAAGGSQEVRVTMAPGSSTCWSVVFLQTVPGRESGINIAQRIGVKVYGVEPGAATEGELRSVSMEPNPAGAGMLLQLEFENLGEDPLRPEGELEVRTLDGNVVGVAPIPAFSVLPGRVRRADVLMELDLPPGEYLGIPILDFGGEYLAGGQTLFRIPGG